MNLRGNETPYRHHNEVVWWYIDKRTELTQFDQDCAASSRFSSPCLGEMTV